MPAVTIAAPTSDTTHTASASPLTVSGTAQDLDGSIASVTWSTDGGVSGGATLMLIGPGQVNWTVPSWYEPHNSFGVTSPGRRWGLAEGRSGGPSNYQTCILLANPGASDAEVTI